MNRTRRLFVFSAATAAGYFGALGLLLDVLDRAGVDVARSGLLIGFAMLAVFAVPFGFGYWLTERVGEGRPWPVALGALTGSAVAFIVPTVVMASVNPQGGVGAAVVAAILALIGAWCVAVAAGAGAFLAKRRSGQD